MFKNVLKNKYFKLYGSQPNPKTNCVISNLISSLSPTSWPNDEQVEVSYIRQRCILPGVRAHSELSLDYTDLQAVLTSKYQ